MFLFRVLKLPQPQEANTIEIYREKAESGDAVAQVQLGYLYDWGKSGLPQDKREAARLYKLSADQGNARGQANLGVFYENGLGGLPQDKREAARLYKLSADQGNAQGQANLGNFYENGLGGLPQDEREAARLYKLSADQGNAQGQADLGFFYQNGLGGLPRDEREAARLYKLSADQGNAFGQADLGFFYAHGLGGLPRDQREAARLYKLSADQEAAAQAEVQKAEHAKRATAEAAKAASAAPAVAALRPAGDLAPEQRALVVPIETELRRIGCYDGTARDWDAPEVRLGLAEYARYAKLSATPPSPDSALLDNLKSLRDRLCPLECSSGEIVVNGRCVSPRPGPHVTAARALERPPAPSAPRVKRAPATRKLRAAAREANSTHVRAASGGHCFSFNGTQYCE